MKHPDCTLLCRLAGDKRQRLVRSAGETPANRCASAHARLSRSRCNRPALQAACSAGVPAGKGWGVRQPIPPDAGRRVHEPGVCGVPNGDLY